MTTKKQKTGENTTAQGVKSTAGLDFKNKLIRGKWILWRWKKDGHTYSESHIQEKRDNILALTNHLFWTDCPTWADVDEIDISWIGDKEKKI